MFYKAPIPKTEKKKVNVSMWDVWLFHHEGTYYLYSLGATDQPGSNNYYMMARSPDGVHWRDIGLVLKADTEAKEGETSYMGTGATWRNPVPGGKPAFQINYSNSRVVNTPAGLGRRQTIFFAQSDDLIHWTKCGPKSEFVPDNRWYQPDGRWDCIWAIPRPGGGLYGYWTATPKPETGGQFGFGESLDGITWKALEPPKVDAGYPVTGMGEVGAIEKIGDRYVMLFGVYAHMETLWAGTPQGPFTAATRNRVCLDGLPHTYFARFFPSPAGLLVCHHSIARDEQVYFAPLKSALVDNEGTLRLGWWKGNEKMKHQPIEFNPPAIENPTAPIAWIEKAFDAQAGVILEGELVLPAAKDGRRGLYIQCDQRQGFASNPVSPASMWATNPLYTESNKSQGAAVLIDSEGVAELGTMKADGSDFKGEKKVNREMAFGSPATFRLLVQGALMEFYLDDILIECYSLPTPATGRIGLIPGGQPSSIRALKAWTARVQPESGAAPVGPRN